LTNLGPFAPKFGPFFARFLNNIPFSAIVDLARNFAREVHDGELVEQTRSGAILAGFFSKIFSLGFGAKAGLMSMGKKHPAAAAQPRRHARTGLYVKTANGLRDRHRKVRRLVERVRAAMPWLEPSDLPACRAWAELEFLGAHAFNELVAAGLLNARGEPRRLLTDYRQLRQVQLSYERDLGMTPAAQMAMKANGTRAALDLVAAMAKPEETEVSVGDEHRTK
jgi:hypothetical protein